LEKLPAPNFINEEMNNDFCTIAAGYIIVRRNPGCNWWSLAVFTKKQACWIYHLEHWIVVDIGFYSGIFIPGDNHTHHGMNWNSWMQLEDHSVEHWIEEYIEIKVD